MSEQRTNHDPAESQPREREREIIITERSRGGVGAVIATIIGLVVAGLIAWAIWAFAFGGGGGEGTDVEVPDEFDVNINQDGGGGGQGEGGGS